MRSNRYRRRINGFKYYVHVFESWTHATVKVSDSRWSSPRENTFLKKRKLFCEDVERFAANVLADAVNNREDKVRNKQEYDDRIERALDVVQEEYESE